LLVHFLFFRTVVQTKPPSGPVVRVVGKPPNRLHPTYWQVTWQALFPSQLVSICELTNQNGGNWPVNASDAVTKLVNLSEALQFDRNVSGLT
jgi:hypothetical protein